MKLIAIILNAIAAGWFAHSACVCAVERIHNWRSDAKWAALGLANAIAIAVFF